MATNPNTNIDTSSWGFPGTETGLNGSSGLSRGNPTGGLRENHPPPRPSVAETSTDRGKSVADPITQGFDRMLERFDKLESRIDYNDRRVARLELPKVPIQDHMDAEFDDAEMEYTDHREQFRQYQDADGRNFGGGRNHWGAGRGRFGDQIAAGQYRGRGGRHQPRRNSHDLNRGGHNRVRSNWDLPQNRHNTWTEEEQFDNRMQTCWDPPQHRARINQPNYDPPRGVKMDAPHFDGSDAANWISRVEYYFEHHMIPEADRLHYVVMLFNPPASEWIFNYRANNQFVTWPEFLEDVRHRFDPQSFRNYTGLIAKLVQTGTVAEYHATFEQYLNRVEDLSEKSLIPIFIQGLKQPLQEKVELQHPTSLAAAMALALR